MASQQRRRSSIDRASIESILKSGEPGQPGAPPSTHVGNSPNRAHFAMSPPPRPLTKHARALSYNPRRPGRLSLSFPVAPITNGSESARPTPTFSNMPSFPPTPAELIPIPSPNDPSGFLVALASQERKVLELREELERAEEELKRLKKQWANHEAYKKKAEIRHVEPLQPLSAVVTEGEGGETSITTRHSAELDRRKALLSSLNIPKESRRKFSGAHTRTLSLLSPERSNFKEPRSFPPVHESSLEYGLSKSSTMPDTSQGITKVSSSRANARHSYQSGMTHGAKQIAEDLKAGMWTFLEDLRQATVGDEAVNGTTNRATLDAPNSGTPRRGSKGSMLSNGKRVQSPRAPSTRTWDSLTGNNSLLDAAESLWSESDSPAPVARIPIAVKKTSRPLSLAAAPVIDDLDDDWSNWDSPTPKSPRWSASTTLSEAAPGTPSSSSLEDSNVKIMSEDSSPPSKRDEIQWPALDKLSPGVIKGNLQRTMSTIMKEWEKSITPPPERQEGPLAKAGKEKSESSSTQDEVAMMSR